MFITKKHISRRTVLKGAGVAVALPFLEAMVPAATALAQTAAKPRLRAGFFYIPHGAVQYDTKFGPEGDRWTPSGSGANYKLNEITSPLEPYKKYVSSIGNLNNPNGSGVHTRNPGTWLNCSQGTITIDQMVAKKIGQETAMPSLEVASETTVQQAAGNGQATAITVSFNDNGNPLPMEHNPKKVFNRMFGQTTAKEKVLNARESDSLLDLILEHSKSFAKELGAGDRVVLDEYLESVREIERRTSLVANIDISNMDIPPRPIGELDEFDQQVELLFDLIAVAFQADLTRVASYIMVAEGTNKQYPFIGVSESFHPISQPANDPERIVSLVKIQKWHMERFANFLKKMAATREGDGSVLDHSIFLYGSNMGNSDKHSNWPIPTVVVGGGSGKMKLGGQHVHPEKQTPLANVHLTLLNKFGIETTRYADSTGMFSEL